MSRQQLQIRFINCGECACRCQTFVASASDEHVCMCGHESYLHNSEVIQNRPVPVFSISRSAKMRIDQYKQAFSAAVAPATLACNRAPASGTPALFSPNRSCLTGDSSQASIVMNQSMVNPRQCPMIEGFRGLSQGLERVNTSINRLESKVDCLQSTLNAFGLVLAELVAAFPVHEDEEEKKEDY